jgi:hypothetical protein
LVFAADSPKSYTIKWLGAFDNPVSPEYTVLKTLNFTGASFDENFNPHFTVTRDLQFLCIEVGCSVEKLND